MEIQFREFDPFNCWIWLRFFEIPDQAEKNYLDGIFDSWYVIGRLGGFNSENLQAQQEGNQLSWMNYDNQMASDTLPALMHNLGQIEYNDKWARCWIDFGTCDSLSIDVLINSLKQIDNDFVRIESLLIGGVNEEWPVEEHPDSVFPSYR